MQRSETRFQTLIDNASDAILVVGRDAASCGTTRHRANGCSVASGALDGRPLAERLEPDDADQLDLLLTGSTASTTVEWHVRHGDGEWRDLEVIAADMRGVAGVDGLVLTMRDITDRKQLDAELRRQALHDSLTSLPNRALFLDRVGPRAQARSPRRPLGGRALHGSRRFQAGQRQPRSRRRRRAVDRRRRAAHDADPARRHGRPLRRRRVRAVWSRTSMSRRRSVRSPSASRRRSTNRSSVGDDHVLVRVSIGIAVGGSDTHNPDDLLRDADAAMYVAKRNGKARHVLFEPAMHEEAQRRLAIAAELRGAIDRERARRLLPGRSSTSTAGARAGPRRSCGGTTRIAVCCNRSSSSRSRRPTA